MRLLNQPRRRNQTLSVLAESENI